MHTKSTRILFFCGALFSFLFTSLSIPLNAKDNVYALIAIDTLSNLASSVAKDQSNMVSLLKELSKHGISVSTSQLTGYRLTKKNILEWINKIPKSHSNTILFYYSGHGTRKKNMKSPWPLLALQSGREFLPASDIKKALIKKKARLTVLLTDCCNNLFIPKGIDLIPDANSGGITNIALSLKRLFLESRGAISITASQPGRPAIGFVGRGGLMTNLLLSSIVENTTLPITWHTVAKYIENKGERFSQKPHYEVILR